jgi:hypothetical protein
VRARESAAAAGELVEKRTADLWRRAAAADLAGGGRRRERARARRQERNDSQRRSTRESGGRGVDRSAGASWAAWVVLLTCSASLVLQCADSACARTLVSTTTSFF